MARNEDPLDRLEFVLQLSLGAPIVPAELDRFSAAFDAIEAKLESPPGKSQNWLGSGLSAYGYPLPLPAADLARAQDIFQRLAQVGGTGITYIQEGLLGLIAITADPASVSFWVDVLNAPAARGTAATARRIYALAALAYLAIRRDFPPAYEALAQGTRDTNPNVRASAVRYLGRAHLDAGRPVPEAVLAQVREIGRQDSSLLVRFQAHMVLPAAGAPPANDNPGGTYTLKVQLQWAKDRPRTIECQAEQTLEDLHLAIQSAFGWDADHLYSFYLSGRAWDSRYEIDSGYEESGWGFSGLALITDEAGADLEAGDAPVAETAGRETGDAPDEEEDQREGGIPLPAAGEVELGELGLALKDKFLYLFDYGDEHRFDVQVVGIQPNAPPGEYPRIVASTGRAPAQYRGYDEEEEDGDDETAPGAAPG